MPCFEGIKYDITSLTSQENSKEEKFLHDNSNAKISVCDRMISRAPVGNYLHSSVLCTHASPPNFEKGLCFIPPREENLCLIYNTLKIHTGFSTFQHELRHCILTEMPRASFLAND